jgi:hypothetical protein
MVDVSSNAGNVDDAGNVDNVIAIAIASSNAGYVDDAGNVDDRRRRSTSIARRFNGP